MSVRDSSARGTCTTDSNVSTSARHNTSYQHTHSKHPVNTPSQYTPNQHTHPNTPPLPIPPLPPYRPTPNTHPYPHQHILSTHTLTPPLPSYQHIRWEVNYGSVFFQVPGLSETTRKGLATGTRPSVTVESLCGCSLSTVQDMLACSYNEAKQVQMFARMFEDNKMILRVGYGDQSDGNGRGVIQARNMLKIDVLLASVFAAGGSDSGGASSSSSSSSSSATTQPSLPPPSFHLISSHAPSSKLLCHRCINQEKSSSRVTGAGKEHNIYPQMKQEFEKKPNPHSW